MTFSRTATIVAILCTGAALTVQAQTQGEQDMMIRGDYRVTRNDLSSTALGLTAATTSDQLVAFAGNSPIIWGRYSPGTATGRIDIIRLGKNASGAVQVTAQLFTPAQGTRWATGNTLVRHFNGVDPFAQFTQVADPEYFRGITLQAFLAVAGMAMRSAGSSIAYVSYPDIRTVREESITASGSDPYQYVASTTGAQYANLRWLAATSVENATDQAFVTAYRVVSCNPVLSPRDGCIARSGTAWIPFDGGNLQVTEYLVRNENTLGRPDSHEGRVLFTASGGFIGGELYKYGGFDLYARRADPRSQSSAVLAKINDGATMVRDSMLGVASSGTVSAAGVTSAGDLNDPIATNFDPSNEVSVTYLRNAPVASTGGAQTQYSSTNFTAGDARSHGAAKILRGTTAGTVQRSATVNAVTPAYNNQ